MDRRQDSSAQRFPAWLVVVGGLAIAAIYAPTLFTRFDFIDDGNLVYSAPSMPFAQRIQLVWQKIVANYEHLGPFRPTLWAHWEAAAELCQGSEIGWRSLRLLWAALSAMAMLGFFRELALAPLPALVATAIAFWNPYRNEIWTSLTLSEGVAMPYALASLWFAAIASRAGTRWPWEVASMLAVLVALGCKNVFVALIPAQIVLRLYAAGNRPSWSDFGRAVLMATTIALPVGHYIYFRLHWHPGQYPPTSLSLAQIRREISGLAGAVSLDFLGVGLALSAWALFASAKAGERLTSRRFHYLTGAVLALSGLAVYAPMPAMSGRYTMPAVWGADLIIATLLTQLAETSDRSLRRFAVACLSFGLVAVALANLGRQAKFAARADLLWKVAEKIERMQPPAERIAWVTDSRLNAEEGIHLRWHLEARGHLLELQLLDSSGGSVERVELSATGEGSAKWAVTGSSSPPPAGPWELHQSFASPYWLGRRKTQCYLWSRPIALTKDNKPAEPHR